jgi:CRISPR/Cas system CMR subunit Cmr6 (Cas7 group RAMP superfamily)
MKKYKVRLTALSNLHIGDGNVLHSFDYIKINDKYHIIDQDKFVDILINMNIQDIFIKMVTNNLFNKDRNIELFCREYNVSLNEITKYVVEGIEESKITRLETFSKNADGLPYIPGSSIKGFISNALGFDPKNHDDGNKIIVSDSKPISLDNLYISKPSHFNIVKKYPRNGQMNLVEFIGRDTIIEFELTLIEPLSKEKMMQKIMEYNKKYYDNFISRFCHDDISTNDYFFDSRNENEIKLFGINSYFRIGKYTNFLLKTKNYNLKYEELKHLINDYNSTLKFNPNSKKISEDNEIAPIAIKMSKCRDHIFRENGVCKVEISEL